MTQDEKIIQLKETVKKLMEPIKGVSYSVVIEAISGHEVIPFDRESERNVSLLERLRSAMDEAMKDAYNKGIQSKRRNEVGNKIEPFVKNALNKWQMNADTPTNSKGMKQTAGYPDVLITDFDKRKIYLECKTYNQETIDSPMRSFYFQASENFKITHSAMHLMVSFEIVEEERDNRKIFVPVHWRLYTLENLKVQMKPEFNANNKDMYKDSELLAEAGT